MRGGVGTRKINRPPEVVDLRRAMRLLRPVTTDSAPPPAKRQAIFLVGVRGPAYVCSPQNARQTRAYRAAAPTVAPATDPMIAPSARLRRTPSVNARR